MLVETDAVLVKLETSRPIQAAFDSCASGCGSAGDPDL